MTYLTHYFSIYSGITSIANMLSMEDRQKAAKHNAIPSELENFIDNPSKETLSKCPKVMTMQIGAAVDGLVDKEFLSKYKYAKGEITKSQKNLMCTTASIVEYCLLFGLTDHVKLIIKSLSADECCADDNSLLSTAIVYSALDIVNELLAIPKVAENITARMLLETAVSSDASSLTEDMDDFDRCHLRIHTGIRMQVDAYKKTISPMISHKCISNIIKLASGKENIEKKSKEQSTTKGTFNALAVKAILNKCKHIRESLKDYPLRSIVTDMNGFFEENYREWLAPDNTTLTGEIYPQAYATVLETYIKANPDCIQELESLMKQTKWQFTEAYASIIPKVSSLNMVRFYASLASAELFSDYLKQPQFSQDPEIVCMIRMFNTAPDTFKEIMPVRVTDYTNPKNEKRYESEQYIIQNGLVAFIEHNVLTLNNENFNQLEDSDKKALLANVVSALAFFDFDYNNSLLYGDNNAMLSLRRACAIFEACASGDDIDFDGFLDINDSDIDFNEISKSLKRQQFNMVCNHGSAAALLDMVRTNYEIYENSEQLSSVAKAAGKFHQQHPDLLSGILLVLSCYKEDKLVDRFLDMFVEHTKSELQLDDDFIDDAISKLKPEIDEASLGELNNLLINLSSAEINQTNTAMQALHKLQQVESTHDSSYSKKM